MTHRQSYIAGLRSLAAALENNEEMPLPDQSTLSVYVYGDEKAQMRKAAKATPGTLEKKSNDTFFRLSREFDGITYEIVACRNATCTPVVVGKKKATKTEIVTPAVTREVEVEENVIEWDCGDILPEDDHA